MSRSSSSGSEMKCRIVMTIIGCILCGVAAGIFQYSAMGMDPFQVFAHGIAAHIPVLGFGTCYLMITVILLIIDFLFLDRKKIGVATFANMFLSGYAVDFTYRVLDAWNHTPSLPVQIFFLAFGFVMACLAAALYYTGDLGVSAYDAIALSLTSMKKWDFRIVRISTDLICTIVGFLLGCMPGVGTVITAFCMGPLIEFFNVHVTRPIRAKYK